MRIAFFTDTFTPEINGVTNTLSKLSDYLTRMGQDFLFVAPDYNTPEQAADEHCHRVSGIRAPINPQSRLAFPLSRDMNVLMEKFNPDVIHITDPLGIGIAGLKYARRNSLPIVMSYHTNFDNYLKYHKLDNLTELVYKYMKWFYSFADLTLCPSKQTMSDLDKRGFARLGLWSRGIDAVRFTPFHRTNRLREEFGLGNRLIFLYVGRVAPEKSMDLLTAAAKQIEKQYGDKAAFVITGDGPYCDVMRHQGGGNIYFTGFKQGRELSEIYASADCFVCPSSTETFGNVMLEAMAAGVPVVCADKGGQLDFAQSGENALLFESDNAQSLTDVLAGILDQPEMLQALSVNARKTALQRDWDSIFDALLLDYETVRETRQVAATLA